MYIKQKSFIYSMSKDAKKYLFALSCVVALTVPITYGLLSLSDSMGNINTVAIVNAIQQFNRSFGSIDDLGNKIGNLTDVIRRIDFEDIEALLRSINASLRTPMGSAEFARVYP
jgi:hypothetical protein